MDTSHESPPADGFPGPLTAERLQRAREQVAAIREAIRQRGVDPAQLPDPVEELSKARAAGGWEQATRFVRSLAAFDIALVDRVHRLASGAIALTPQWEQLPDGTIRDYRGEIYARAIDLSYPSRRGSLFDMSYAALAEQAGTTMWTIDERFYNGARAMGLAFVMHPGRDPLP